MTNPATNFGQVALPGKSSVFSFAFAFDGEGTLGREFASTQRAAGLDFQDAGTGSCAQPKNGSDYKTGDSCTVDVTFNRLVQLTSNQ